MCTYIKKKKKKHLDISNTYNLSYLGVGKNEKEDGLPLKYWFRFENLV